MKKNALTVSYDKKSAKEKAPVSRLHIILMDGTWNDETGVNLDGIVTNVVHMHRLLVSDGEQQLVRYHRGVGNDNDNSALGHLFGGATGSGIRKIVDTAYARFVADWEHGDRVCIFGFSRGSAAARMLASKINAEGVPDAITVTFAPVANQETNVIEQHLTAFEIGAGQKKAVDIEFLGVWDTVSSLGFSNVVFRLLGIKKRDLFTDNHIADNIKRAVHLLAIDESRKTFTPSLMNRQLNEEVIEEVWFPGVHSDLAGGYKENEIGKVTLHFMLKRFREHLYKQEETELQTQAEYLKVVTTPYEEEPVREAGFHFQGLSFGEGLRTIGVQVEGEIDANIRPKIHRLYYDLCHSPETYSVVENKAGKKLVKFQYMPFNVKLLRREFDIVS